MQEYQEALWYMRVSVITYTVRIICSLYLHIKHMLDGVVAIIFCSVILACLTMRLSQILILLAVLSLSLCKATDARLLKDHHSPCRLSRTARNLQAESLQTAITIEYIVITANSPDCEPSLVDNFPVRV